MVLQHYAQNKNLVPFRANEFRNVCKCVQAEEKNHVRYPQKCNKVLVETGQEKKEEERKSIARNIEFAIAPRFVLCNTPPPQMTVIREIDQKYYYCAIHLINNQNFKFFFFNFKMRTFFLFCLNNVLSNLSRFCFFAILFNFIAFFLLFIASFNGTYLKKTENPIDTNLILL